MKINSRLTGKFRVVEFVEEHNHYLSSPNKTHMHRSHRQITSSQAVDIEMASSVGIAPKAAHDLLAKQAGGRQNIGFISEDYKNYLRSKRTREAKIGDTGGVLEYLQKMQFQDPNFFYAIQVDEDDLITNVFWSDGKMKADYVNFGDVVCFDTTYRKNNEGRPIALFVGVNHHKQTTIFGAALLYDETSMTFEWLFDTFSRAMHGEKPKTILTDQDAAMAKALASRWPETHHRLCIWHIYQNAANHLNSVFSEYKSFAKDFSSCIYDFEEEEDFMNEWNQMLDKYDLRDNEWLKRMFGIKKKWALVYDRQMFCADMTTTQRSESMNSVLKRYVNYKHKFLDFFNHFHRLLEDRRYEELRADFKANTTFPSLQFPCELLRHAACVYMPEAFKCVQNEWCKSIDASCLDCGEHGSVRKFEITPFGKQYYHAVLYDSSSSTINCSCKKFEFAGILCSHVMKVFIVINIVKIPSQYILKRWTRKAKSGFEESAVDTSEMDPKVAAGVRYRELCKLYAQLATRASENEETYKIAKDSLLKMLEKVDTMLQGVKSTTQSYDATDSICEKEVVIGDDKVSKIKGIKAKVKTTSGKRLRSSLEKGSKMRNLANKSNTKGSSKVVVQRSPSISNTKPAVEDKLHDASSVPSVQFQRLNYTQNMQQYDLNKDGFHMVAPIQQQDYLYSQSPQVQMDVQESTNQLNIINETNACSSDASVIGMTSRSISGVDCNEYCGCQLPCQGGIMWWCKGYGMIDL